jgi:NAD(P)-dependent dehydrogenase (short-subunit alcohol dehydrogenase family)
MVWSLATGLEGRGVIVTGATGGIGREVTKAFATAGAKVMAGDLLAPDCEQLVDEIDGSGHTFRAFDLSEVSGHEDLIAAAQQSLGEVYALVHLVAVLRRQPQLADVTERYWDLQVDTT